MGLYTPSGVGAGGNTNPSCSNRSSGVMVVYIQVDYIDEPEN
jgi:hypothetical protein